MAEINYKKYVLNDVFTSRRGNSKYTKSYCNKYKGNYEVFTGTTIGSFGYIDTYDYEEELLTYTTDGENAGTLKVLEGKYNIGGHRAMLFPKQGNLLNKYFLYTLQNLFFANVKRGDVPSISWNSIKHLEVSVPIDGEGNISIKSQYEIVEKYQAVQLKLSEIEKKMLDINEVEITILNSRDKIKLFSINEIFDLSVSTNSSKFTKTFIKKNNGDIPVYGASASREIPSYGYVKDNAILTYKEAGRERHYKVKYFENCLTYNIDGLAGYVFYRKGRFTLSEKVRPLILNEKFENKVNLDYLQFTIEPLFRAAIKGRKGIEGKNEYTKLGLKDIEKVQVSLPINEIGQIDLEKQNEIVRKIHMLENIKNTLSIKVSELKQLDLIF